MANSKISALTAATTPVAGTEVLPIVQSSATVKLAISDLNPGLSTITAAKGGTGQTTYAVGDLLYASATTTLSKLADVATGNALISGGVTTAPSWGKIGLTTHVSGTLPVANGGTALTSFTNRGVVYASSTSVLATGSALEFDGTNFGVGTGGNTLNHQSVVYKGGANSVYFQISNGATGLGSTQGIRLGLTAAGASELYAVTSFTCYVDGSSAYSISTARDITVTAGNIIPGTAAKGINFTANTPLAGMTSQLLNWYEEGTYTPTISAGTGSITSYTLTTANYTRIGRQVTANIVLTITNAGTGTGALGITLPYTNGAAISCGAGRENALTGYILQAYVNAASNLLNVYNYANGTVILTNSQVRVSITYFV